MTMTSILGISALYHDSAAAFIRDGGIVTAIQEGGLRVGNTTLRFHAMRLIPVCRRSGSLDGTRS